MTERLDLPRRFRDQLEALLRDHVPEVEVWAYGSRVNGRSHEGSDLDLVLRSPTLEPLGEGYFDLLEAIEQSNIPLAVQAHDWAKLPESFQEEIERDYVVIQPRKEKQPARTKWRQVILGDLAEIKHGFAFKGDYIDDKPQGDVLLTPGNFAIGGGFKGEKFKYYYGYVPEDFVLCEGELLVTMTDLSKQADTLGYPALVPVRADNHRYLHNQRLGKVLLKGDLDVDIRYLYYVMCSSKYRHEILASATGTTVKHTSPDRIKQFRFMLPSLPEQRSIAHILGTLDDKIELNRRMNETLEEMARALFKSWFVDFDPVRAKMDGRWRRGESLPGLPAEYYDLFPDRLVESELEEMPEGWRIVSLPKIIEINPSRYLPKGESAPYLGMASMPTKGHVPDAAIDRPYSSGMRFTNGDTLVARITPCLENGKTAYVDFLQDGEVGWGSTEYIVMRPRSPIPNEFAYCLARSASFREFAIQNMTGTSGRQRVPAKALSQCLLPSPPQQIATKFGNISQSLLARASEAVRQSRTLAALRDTLLPKLISGELRTRNAARFIRETKS